MMHDMMGGMVSGMGIGGLLVMLLLILAAFALIKYVFFR